MFRKALLFLFFLVLHSLAGSAQHTLVKTSDDELFRSGLELLDREKYGAARETFQQYVNLNRGDLKSIDAEYYIAFSALNLDHPDAENLFQRFIFLYPHHSKASTAYYDLGSFYYNRKKYDKAIEYLSQINASQLTPAQRVEADFRLGYSYFSQKDFENAGRYFNKIKYSGHKYTYAANYYAGYIGFRNGEYEVALADLKKAEQNETYKLLVPYMIVNVYYKQNAFDDLISYAAGVISSKEKISNADEFYLLTGEAYFRKEEFGKAAEYFNKYLSEIKSKPAPEVQYRLAFAEYKSGNFESAVNHFKNIASGRDSIGQSAAYYLGVSYLKTGNKQFALTGFDQARKASYSKELQEEALFHYGKVSFDLERYTDAIFPLREFVKAFPRSSHQTEASELLSEALLNTSNYSEAISYIESIKGNRSLRLNTAYQRVTFYKGIELFNNNKYREAIQFFNKAIEFPIVKDIFVAATFWKAESYSVLKEYDNAINTYSIIFQRATPENEHVLKARYGIGHAYYNTKQYDKALPHFRHYVDALKNASQKQFYNDALLRLADLYYVMKNYDEALKNYDLAIMQKNPESDYAYYQKGIVLGLDGKVDLAKENFETVIRRYPNSLYIDNALFQKALLDLQTSSYREAIEGFTAVTNLKTASPYIPYAYKFRAISNFNLQKYNEAINDYKLILDKYVSHAVAHEALLGIQEALIAAGRSEEFTQILARYKEVHPSSDALINIEFENAKGLYNDQKYKQSLEAFNNYLKSYPNTPNATDARFFMGEAHARLNEIDLAIKQYNLVLNDRASSFYTRAIQRIADLEYARQNFDQAKNHYRLLLKNARNNKDRFTAWTGLVESYYRLNKPDSVNYFANEILVYGNATVNAESKALLYLGKVAFDKEQFDTASDYFARTLNTAKDESGAEAQYLTGMIQFKKKDHRKSIETLYDLNNTFAVYEHWLGRSFLLIAENFIAMNEMFQARATLNSIIEKSPHKESVEKAKIRLKELEEKEKEGGEHEE